MSDARQPLPQDPDVEPGDVASGVDLVVLAVISLGGVLGSLGRWGLGELVPHAAGQFGWSTFVVNVTGAFAIGVLLALVAGPWSHTRLVRPFLGVGVLGGWTTFSAYALDTRDLLAADRVATALVGYLLATLVAGLLAAAAGLALGRVAGGSVSGSVGGRDDGSTR